jgi:hypothetical protein
MPAKLSEAVVKQRLQELRNLRVAHVRDGQKIADLTDLVHRLETLVVTQQAQINTQGIRIAELETMVFGKKPHPPAGTSQAPSKPGLKPKQPRNSSSYRRSTPPDADVTHIEMSSAPDSCQCGGELTNLTEHERYVQDIPLPDLTDGYRPQVVTKYVVQRGVCVRCGKARSGRDLGGAVVALGSNVRLLICHLISTMGMSYSQVQQLLLSLYRLDVSDGEIAGILHSQSKQWQPSYQQLKTEIQSAPVVHSDETPWPIQYLEGLGYAWMMCPAANPKVFFSFEGNRGGVHARTLFGPDFGGIRISDDYPPYRTLPGSQQLCWAHLYRCIRDLRYNSNLPPEQLPYVTWWYECFADIYQQLTTYLAEPFDEQRRTSQADELWARLQLLLVPSPDDPDKLVRLKGQLTRAGQDKLFICLPKDTPCDNNRAERDLRGLVLKRHRSFGSKTPQGARTLGVVLSLCLTTWRTNPNNYFRELAQLGV